MNIDIILIINNTVVQYSQKFKKNIAIDLRKKGYSFTEIQKRFPIPKSTLSVWLKDVEVDAEHADRLRKKRSDVAKRNSQARIQRYHDQLQRIDQSASRQIKDISKRELWLLGLALYWRERTVSDNRSDMKHGVRFSSYDPRVIGLFLRWLTEVGSIDRADIVFDLFIRKDRIPFVNTIMDHWSRATGFSRKHIAHVYVHKQSVKDKTRQRISRRSHTYGFLRIHVKSSSLLARQISGWMDGVFAFYGLEK